MVFTESITTQEYLRRLLLGIGLADEEITLFRGTNDGARAQQAHIPVIGFLSSGSPYLYADRVRAFHQGLSDTGFAEGRNVEIDYRWSGDQYDLMPVLAADLVRRRVTVIATFGGIPAAQAAKAMGPGLPSATA